MILRKETERQTEEEDEYRREEVGRMRASETKVKVRPRELESEHLRKVLDKTAELQHFRMVTSTV